MAWAVPACPAGAKVTQPDGTQINVINKGDEWNNWVETMEGYTIAEAPGGVWHYVSGYNGKVPVLEPAMAHDAAPAGLPAHLRPAKKDMMPSATASSENLENAPYGTYNGKILFILASFSDTANTYSAASFATFLKTNIKGYFKKASYGKVTLSPAAKTSGPANGVVGWLNLGYPHPNTGSNTDIRNQQITKDAILMANNYVNFQAFDTNNDGYVDSDELAVVVIVAGYERSYTAIYTPSVWGHKWSLDGVGAPTVDGVIVGAYHSGKGGYAQFGEIHQSTASDKHKASMGIMVHELGHLIFGLPDLYDTDYSSSGVGAFCVMAGGSWGKATSDKYSGQRPVLPSAWIKYNRGWVNGIAVGEVTQKVTAAGAPTATSANTVFRETTDVATEYFMVENRKPIGYDRGLQKWLGTAFGGVAIWHIDEAVATNTDDSHRMVDLEVADGTPLGTTAGSKTDLWYVGNNTAFSNTSDPNSKKYNLTSTCIQITAKSGPATIAKVEFKKPTTCPCDAENCGTFTGVCNPTLACLCFKKTDGTGACVDNFECLGAGVCTSDADCPAGKQCFTETCCGGSVCGPTTCTGGIQGPRGMGSASCHAK